MLRFRFSVPCVLCLVAVACSREATFTEPVPPLATINFVNAVPDTNQMAFRIVDIASNAGLYGATFRSGSTFPEGIEAGTRHIRVFFDTTDVVLAKKVWLDTTYSFVANEHYSFTLSGFTRTGATPSLGGLIVADAALPTPAAGKFAIRVVNLAPSFAGAVPALADTTVQPDVFVRRIAALPGGAPEATSLGYVGMSQYVELDTGLYRVALTATGTLGPAIVQASVPPGVLGTATANPIAGSSVAGSVLTAVIVPRSVVGSRAPQGGSPSAKTVESVTRSNDTVTVQTGSLTVLVNRPGGKADSTLSKTNGGATTGVSAGDVVIVSGATEVDYNGWQVVAQQADSLSCNPANAADTPTKCAVTVPNDTATTRFRFRYRITGTPTSPATGTPVYRIYPPSYTAADFTIPFIIYLVDRRPPNTY